MTFEDPAWLVEEAKPLERIHRGDRAACAALYRAFAAPLCHRVLWPRLSDGDLVADALAEIFRSFLERLDDYQARGSSVWSWLATIAANKANDLHRAQARGGRALHNDQTALELLWEASGPPRPDEAHEQSRLRDAVDRVLGAINPRYRRAIELCCGPTRLLRQAPHGVLDGLQSIHVRASFGTRSRGSASGRKVDVAAGGAVGLDVEGDESPVRFAHTGLADSDLAKGVRDRRQLGVADRSAALAQSRTAVEIQAGVPTSDSWLRCDGEGIEVIRSARGSIRHAGPDR